MTKLKVAGSGTADDWLVKNTPESDVKVTLLGKIRPTWPVLLKSIEVANAVRPSAERPPPGQTNRLMEKGKVADAPTRSYTPVKSMSVKVSDA
jgi:hypothetical protein